HDSVRAAKAQDKPLMDEVVSDQAYACPGPDPGAAAPFRTRTVERGGLFWDAAQGIALGCPLSPLLGAFVLGDLDQALERLGLFFVRFMDDVLVLAPTCWKLRLAKHSAKTFIGRIDRGFDFLGYHLAPGRLTLAQSTIAAFVERAHQLYEQEPAEGA